VISLFFDLLMCGGSASWGKHDHVGRRVAFVVARRPTWGCPGGTVIKKGCIGELIPGRVATHVRRPRLSEDLMGEVHRV